MRRRRRSSGTVLHEKRETIAFANPRLFSQSLLNIGALLRSIEDRRTFHPERAYRPARSFNKAVHRLVMSPKVSGPRTPGKLPLGVHFEAPKKVLICVRRERRREVLHALKKTGKGSSRKFKRRNFYSDVRC